MFKQHSPVHAANTTAWKPMDFLALQDSAGQGFSGSHFRSEVESGFRQARIEAMPDNSLHAPAHWRPAAKSASAATPPAAPNPAATPMPAAAASAGTGLDAPAAEQIRAQAFQEGLAQGRREGAAEALAQLQPQIEQARNQGLQDIRNLLIQLGEAVNGLHQQPETLHEPLKRLALHLAEELVLGELALDASAIDRLVQRCVDTIDGQGASQLTVELHPSDLRLLQQHPDAEADRPQGWLWQANEQLMPGSVRMRLNEAVVSDFVEHRLHSLAKQLLAQPQRWAAQSAFVPEKLAERRRQDALIEDALPRMNTAMGAAVNTAMNTATNAAIEPAGDAPPHEDDEHV